MEHFPQPGAGVAMQSTRSSLAVTLSVWKALFLRESLTRLFSARGAWFWLFAEPVLHVAYLMVIFTVVRVQTVGGIETAIWIMIGLLAFFMFRRTADQVMNGVSANRALFAYRQVKPVDTVLVRGGLEALLLIIVIAIMLAGAALLGYEVLPGNPLAVFEAFIGLWLVGMGFGLVASVTAELVPELARVLNLAMMPMYLISGVIFPLSAVPLPYRDWLLLNPIAHGLEAVRLGFAPYYHAVPGLSVGYLYGFALASVLAGLALHRRFRLRLSMQ